MIRMENIQRVFQVGDQEVHALKDINIDIGAGEYLSIMGPSGSGKSTLLNIIGLLDRPSAGTYRLEEQDVTHLDEEALARIRRHKIGFIFQFFHLLPRLTAAENIALPMTLEGIDPAERKKRVDNILRETGISDRAHHKPEQLSGGQRQRVAIARSTIMHPGILLADEPTGNLDRHSGHEIIELLEDLNHQGITLIVVTHDPEIGKRATRRIHMVDGQIENDTNNH